MLSAHRISAPPAAAAKYYAVGDYYTKGADEPSEWRGEGAARLGLGQGSTGGGTVSSSDLEKILSGQLQAGERAVWIKNGADTKHHPGWDFTLSAPKTASLAAIIAGDERLVEAHREASKTAIAFLERYAGVRVRENGAVVHRATGNLVVASFTEFWSREQEAQLHEHNVTANMTYDARTDAWRSVEGLSLYTALRATGQVYQNEYAWRVSTAIGYEVSWNVERGTFDLVGVPQTLVDQHSTRSRQIDAYVAEKGLDGRESRERAALATRRGKSATSDETLVEHAKARAGADYDKLVSLVDEARARANDRSRQGETPEQKHAAERAKSAAISRALRYGLSHATAGEAVVEEADIIRHALQVGGPAVTLADIDKALARLKEKGQFLETTEQTGGKRLYRGRLLAKDLAAEERFSRLLTAGKDTLKPMLREETAERRLGGFRIRTNEAGETKEYPLSPEQHAAAKAILTSKDRIHHVQGAGGAGKSAMVGAIAGATRLRAHLAVAKTAVAAAGLGKDAGLEWMTVDKFLSDAGSAIPRGGVLFVDEATMLGTRAAARIDEIAAKNNFRVVVIGDAKQLPAIDQGKPHELAGRLGAEVSELKDSRRHKTDAVKTAVAAAREGKIGEALSAIDRVHTRDLKDISVAIAHDWHRSEARERSKILALDNKTRVAVSEEVRRLLIRDGSVERAGVAAEIHSVRVMTDAQKKIAEFYPTSKAAITFHLGSKALGAEPGATFTIAGRSGDTIALKREVEKGGKRVTETHAWRPARSSIRGVVVYDIQRRELASGDLIQWKRNEPALDGVRNGFEGKVVALKGSTAEIAFSDGKTRSIDIAKNPHWDHAYALTVYKAQGATYDRAFVVAPAKAGPLLNQQTFYTALSRARYAIDLYTNDPEKLARTLANAPGGKTSAIEGTGRLPNGKNRAGGGVSPRDLPPSSAPMNGRGSGIDNAIPLPESAAAAADGARVMRAIERRNENGRRNGELSRAAFVDRLNDLLKRGRRDDALTREEQEERERTAKTGRDETTRDQGVSAAERAKARDAEIQKEATREPDRGGREISR